MLALFQTRPVASHRLVAVLVAVSEPFVGVLLPVAVCAAVPVAVAEPVPVAVFDGVAVQVAEPVSVIVFDELSVAVMEAVLLPALETLVSWAASAATAGRRSAAPDSAASGAASVTRGWSLRPQDAANGKMRARITDGLVNRLLHIGGCPILQ